MRHCSLFSGIGGFDLAAEWAGWENVFHCEKEPFCQKILHQHFPKSILHNDIKTTDFSVYRGTIHVLSGGFPCQPYSAAGKRLGKEDERHLWPEMLRSIREISPRWVVGENVRGLTNWSEGLVFDEVQADLEAEGYEVLPFLLPAAGVNAPHERYRIWFIAYASGTGISFNYPATISNQNRNNSGNTQGWKQPGRSSNAGFAESFADTLQPNGEKIHIQERDAIIRPKSFSNSKAWRDDRWHTWPTESPICGGNDGIPNRMDRIKTLGNAVVPQVVYKIFTAINQYNDSRSY